MMVKIIVIGIVLVSIFILKSEQKTSIVQNQNTSVESSDFVGHSEKN